MKIDLTKVLLGLSVCLVIIICYMVYQFNNVLIDTRIDVQRLLIEGMYNPENKDRVDRTRGVYFPSDDYYCVSTVNMDYDELKYTNEHELCHSFVNDKYTHFCNSSYRNITKMNKIE